MTLTIGETKKGLEELAVALATGSPVTKEQKNALAAALTVVNRLSNLTVLEWTVSYADSDDEEVETQAAETRSALFFSDKLKKDHVTIQQLIESGEAETDPRVILTTPAKAEAFLNGVGFKRTASN